MASYDNKGIKGSRLERLVTKILTKIVGLDGDVVHKAGSETITGIKTFNNAVSPRQTGDGFMKQSKVFECSIITPYADWNASQKDGNHYRTWTLDITSTIVTSSTHGNIVVTMMGSYYSTLGNGTLQKVITFQIYNGNVVISKGNYTLAQSPCADEFEISDVFKSGSNYFIQVVNRKPTANNYPLRLEIEMFNRNASAILDNVTMTESITEGLPSWAVEGAQVIATKVDTRWYYFNASNTTKWYKLVTVTQSGDAQGYAGDMFAVATRDSGDHNSQCILAISPWGNNDNTLYAKLITLNSRTLNVGTGTFGDTELYIYRTDNRHYTLYGKFPRYSGVKIAAVLCEGTLLYESDVYDTQPANLIKIDQMSNIYTPRSDGAGGPLQPVYISDYGVAVPSSVTNTFTPLADIGVLRPGGQGASDPFDTSLTPIIPDYIYCQKRTDAIKGYSLNIQRFIQGKVYRIMISAGWNSVILKLGNHDGSNPHTFNVHHKDGVNLDKNWWEMPAGEGSEGVSWVAHVVRVDSENIYIIDGY